MQEPCVVWIGALLPYVLLDVGLESHMYLHVDK